MCDCKGKNVIVVVDVCTFRILNRNLESEETIVSDMHLTITFVGLGQFHKDYMVTRPGSYQIKEVVPKGKCRF